MSRAAKITVVAVMVVFAFASTLWFASGDDREDEALAVRRVHDPVLGLSLSIPANWTFATADVEGTGLSVGNGPVTWSEESPCTRNDRTHVDLGISLLSEGGDANTKRPARFTKDSGSGLQRDPLLPCGAYSQRIDFVSQGSPLSANLRFGADATERDRTSAYAVVASAQP